MGLEVGEGLKARLMLKEAPLQIVDVLEVKGLALSLTDRVWPHLSIHPTFNSPGPVLVSTTILIIKVLSLSSGRCGL